MSGQDTSNPYGLAEGLPESTDYRPDLLGQADLEAGEPEQVWEQWGLELVPVLFDGEDTGRRLVSRNGEYLASVSDDYKLLPNERVVEAGNAVARELGARPFHQFDGDWYITLDDHVFQDQEARRVHALYAFDEPVDMGGGDTVQFGLAFHNSIDGSMSFQISLFTFRHACANMVFMGTNNRGMSFDGRDVLVRDTHRHTASLDLEVDALVERAKRTLTLKEAVDNRYREWRETFIRPEHVDDILRRMPNKDLPTWAVEIGEQIDAALDDDMDEADRHDVRGSIIESEMPSQTSIWETYNDLTESVWHDNGTNDRTKRRKMKKVHRAFPIADGVR